MSPKKDPSFYTRQAPNDQSFHFDNAEEFWDEPIVKFIPSHNDMLNVQTFSNGEFNGSPPASKKEQEERMEYITSVYENEYGDSYPEGEYLAYLYTSHYTENAQYNHSNPQASFRSLLPYIICSEDIIAYNQFFARANNIKVMNDFKAIGGALSAITADGLKKAAFVEGCGDIRKVVLHFTPQLKAKLEELYITDEETVVTSLAQIAGLHNKNYEQARTDNELIQLIVDQTDIGGYVNGLVETFVDLISTCAKSVFFTSGVGAIVGATWSLAEIMMETYQFASLYALAATLHGRQGDRVEIYAGIATRP